MTLVEILIVMAMLSVLLGMAAMNFRAPAERAAANAVQSFIQQARFDAIKTNRPVVVAFDSATNLFTALRMTNSTETVCSRAGTTIRELSLADYGGVTTPDSEYSMLWLPTGQPRACPTGATPLDMDAGLPFRLIGNRGTLAVEVAAAGEVAVR